MLPSFDMVVVDEVVSAAMKFAFGLRFLLAPKRRLSLSMTHQFLQCVKLKMIGHRKWWDMRFHPPTGSFNVVDPVGTAAERENTKRITRTNLSVRGGSPENYTG